MSKSSPPWLTFGFFGGNNCIVIWRIKLRNDVSLGSSTPATRPIYPLDRINEP